MAKAKPLWERRIAMMSTVHMIKNTHFKDALRIADSLKNDAALCHREIPRTKPNGVFARNHMNALVMIAHGSRREEANTEFLTLVEKVRTSAASKFDIVAHCFLEIASPSLTKAVKDVIGKGATDVSIFPYFLNSGNHVLKDIPEMVNHLAHEHPEYTIRVLPYFGTFKDIAEIISRQLPGNIQSVLQCRHSQHTR